MLAVTGCSGDAAPPDSGDELSGDITIWTWSPHAEDVADLFMEYHPNINVEVVNPGSGPTTMERLLAAFQAGSGAPDIAMIQYFDVAQFAVAGDLIPLEEFGIGDIADDFADSVMAQLTVNGGIYGTPLDASPMAFIYRQDIFEEAGLNPPTTWDEFAEVGRELHEKTGKYIANSPLADNTAQFLFWQTGDFPVRVDGEQIAIDYEQSSYERVLAYWQDLAAEGVTGDLPIWTPEWNAAFAQGDFAGWIAPSWARVILESSAPETVGLWRASQMPTWEPGERASAEWSGSAYTVTAQSENPAAAAEYVKWVNHDPRAYQLAFDLTGAFPVLKSFIDDEEFLATPSDFYGGQPALEVFADEMRVVPPGWQWTPFNTVTQQALDNQFAELVQGRTTPAQALQTVQEQVSDYAVQQGFTVD